MFNTTVLDGFWIGLPWVLLGFVMLNFVGFRWENRTKNNTWWVSNKKIYKVVPQFVSKVGAHNSNFTMVYGTQITIVTGVYDPSYD